MSLPKEPRQKMINMMYLVLTALLALNVSVEVLNAFKTVNHSIEGSNKVVSDKNSVTYKSFQEALDDPKTAEKAKVWAPSAFAAQKLSTDLCKYIEGLKDDLIEQSNPQMKDGKKEYTEGNLDAATRIMDTKGEGPKLYQSLGDFKKNLIGLLDPAKYPDQPQNIKDDLQKDMAKFQKELPLDLSIPESEAGNTTSTGSVPKDWTIRYFHMTPTVAALTILSKFQSDIKNSEAQVIDLLHKKIGEVKVVFDKFEPLVGTNATYLMPGDELEVTAGIGAFSAAAQPKVYVNGSLQSLNSEGVADYKTKVSATGTVNVKIEYTKPDGSTGTIDKAVKYTVGQPSGASIFLEKMNVVYMKEDNPVKISGGSTGRENVHVSFTNGEINHLQGDEYVVVPTTPGEGKIIVDAKGQKTAFDLRIKYLPDPTAFVGSHKGGAVGSAEFRALGGVIARLENSDFISPFTVVSYKIAAMGGEFPQYTEAKNDGSRWTGAALNNIVNKLKPGTRVFIDDIKAKGKDGRERTLPSMMFDLKQ
jgi:gliding motility-associated protein GldM